MLKTQTEVFRGYGKVGEMNAQTAVECRFGGEVETVLCTHASVVLANSEASNGEVKYTGRAHFFIVYEDAEKRVCRAEKGVEFSAKAQEKDCCPAFTPRVALRVENISLRREGASVYATALIGAEITLYGERSFEYLTEGDMVVKRETLPVCTAHLCSGSAETEDEFETEFIGDILLHSETVNVTEVSCTTGTMVADGEINVGILALKGGNSLASYERLVPFHIEIPCDFASSGSNAQANVCVERLTLRADSDEERGSCRILAEITLSVEGCVYEETELEVITDAFSCTNEVGLQTGELCSEGCEGLILQTERIAGKAALSGSLDFSDTLQAVVLQRAEANLVELAEGCRAEGVAMATLLVMGADGSRRGVEMSLPFSVPVEGHGKRSVNIALLGTSARQRQEGEIEAEATLKISLCGEKTLRGKAVVSAQEGAPVKESDSAVSVYIPRAGDGLWELSKSLKKPPEEVSQNNPDIEFPIREGQRVVVYRKKTLPV